MTAGMACSRCGGELVEDVALVNTGHGCIEMPLPAYCPDAQCRRQGQAERDEAAIAKAIAAGVIDA